MRDSSFAESRVRSALVGSQKRVLKRWTNGSQCCEKPLRQTTTGWTKFWRGWKNTRKVQHDLQNSRRYRIDVGPVAPRCMELPHDRPRGTYLQCPRSRRMEGLERCGLY